jgi:hypothetical protein
MTISSRSALVRLLAVGSAALAVACGGGTPAPKTSEAQGAPAGHKDLRDDNVAGTTGKADASTAALLDKLLADTPSSGGRKDAPAPAPPPVAAPAAAHPAAHATNDDTFDDDTKRIQETVPTWDNGTGITARFLKEATGARISLIYVDATPPAFNKELNLWVIEAKAKVDGKIAGTFAILMKDVAAGRHEGSPEKKSVIFISGFGEKLDLKGNDTMWSTNKGSWCELVLRAGKKGKHLEGNFRAKLMSNDGQSFQSVESGYLYINQ